MLHENNMAFEDIKALKTICFPLGESYSQHSLRTVRLTRDLPAPLSVIIEEYDINVALDMWVWMPNRLDSLLRAT